MRWPDVYITFVDGSEPEQVPPAEVEEAFRDLGVAIATVWLCKLLQHGVIYDEDGATHLGQAPR